MMFTSVINLKGRSMWWKTLILFPQMSNLRVKKLHCMCLKTMKHWSRWSLEEGVLQWDMFPEPTVALDWLFDRINLDSKIQIRYIDIKSRLADILTKGNFTRDEWNHLLSLFNISHFSSTVCSAAMAKRIQQESGEERVTAKSRPMMNLTSRMPSVVSSSASSSPRKTWYGNQDPWKSVVEDDWSGKPDGLPPASYSKLDYGRSLSSQEWKSEVAAHDRSGKPDETSWNEVQHVHPHHEDSFLDGNAQSVRYGEIIHDGWGQLDSANFQADSENFVMGSDAAEFVNKVKDQVRKRQKRMSNVADSGEEHSKIGGMFMAATKNAATIMGKNFLDNQNSIMISTDLSLKKMFDITAKLVGEQEEINNADKIHWEKHSWKHLSLIGDETVINLQRAKVYVFSDSVLCLGRVHQHPESNKAWKERTEWITTDKSCRDYDGINGEPTEFEWNIFPGFTTLQLCGKVTDLLSRWGEAPETFTGRTPFMSMFNDISCDKKDNKEECVANAKVVLARKFGIGVRIWSLSKDNSQSWVRISHGSNKFVIDSNYNNTEVPADLPEEKASQPIAKVLRS